MVVVDAEGHDAASFPLSGDGVTLGCQELSDPYLSPKHARIWLDGEQARVRDLDSVNGVFLRIREPHRLQAGDLLLLGLEVLEFQPVSDLERRASPLTDRGVSVFGSVDFSMHSRLRRITRTKVSQDVHHLHKPVTTLGRESADIVFSGDVFLSRLHAEIRVLSTDEGCALTDLGSANGTFVAVRTESALRHGDHLRLGQVLLRLDLPQ